MKVTLSSRARHNLEGIRNYIEQDNPVRAISFVDELRDIMKRLTDMPRAFPLVPRYEHHGIRRRSYKRYEILYSVEISSASLLQLQIASFHYSLNAKLRIECHRSPAAHTLCP